MKFREAVSQQEQRRAALSVTRAFDVGDVEGLLAIYQPDLALEPPTSIALSRFLCNREAGRYTTRYSERAMVHR